MGRPAILDGPGMTRTVYAEVAVWADVDAMAAQRGITPTQALRDIVHAGLRSPMVRRLAKMEREALHQAELLRAAHATISDLAKTVRDVQASNRRQLHVAAPEGHVGAAAAGMTPKQRVEFLHDVDVVRRSPSAMGVVRREAAAEQDDRAASQDGVSPLVLGLLQPIGSWSRLLAALEESQ